MPRRSSAATRASPTRSSTRWANQIANALAASGIRRGDHVALLCPNLPVFSRGLFRHSQGRRDGRAAERAAEAARDRLPPARQRREGDVLLSGHGRAADGGSGEGRDRGRAGVQAADRVAASDDSDGSRARDGPEVDSARAISSAPSRRRSRPWRRRPTTPPSFFIRRARPGQPKGAELTHLNMVVNGMCSAELCAGSHDESGRHATAITLPLFHATAQTAQMLAYLHLGGTLVLLPRFDPAALLAAMTAERITHWIGVPTMYWTLLKHAREQNIDVSTVAATLRLSVSGGAPMPVELMRDFEKTFGVRIIEGYGLSETSPVATFNHRRSAVEARHGRSAAVRRRHHDRRRQRRPVETGQPGEVVIRGHNVMKGYYKQPEATAEAMRNGWFHTGDIGTLRRRWLPQHRRSQEGHDSARRLQRVSARARRSDADAPGRVAGRGRRRARRAARRRGEGVRGEEARRRGDRRRAARVVPGAVCRLQISAPLSSSARNCRRAPPERSSSGSCASNRMWTLSKPNS